MNAHADLPSGQYVFVELNTPGRGEDTVYLDDFDETGLRALVFSHGYVVVEQDEGPKGTGAWTLGQFRIVEEFENWSVYKRTGISVEKSSILVGPDRLRTLGMLLQSLKIS